jgi:hypothetical protein
MLPTAGLGLGLLGLRVGLADRMQLKEAKEASLEGAILKEAKNVSLLEDGRGAGALMMDNKKMRIALEESRCVLIEREEMEMGEVLCLSGGDVIMGCEDRRGGWGGRQVLVIVLGQGQHDVGEEEGHVSVGDGTGSGGSGRQRRKTGMDGIGRGRTGER